MNYELFNQIFTQRNYVIGSAILNTVSSGISADMIPQIVYLGDPAIELIIPKNPDFVVKSSDISVSPQNPLKDDTVSVIVTIKNLGVTFPGDSVTVELFNNVPDTANLIGKVKVPSFGEQATVVFPWQ
ncbi:MAG TPA: hypothetical protein VKY40_02355, partial [Halanaerobiales bacterium]|nr:hypothetical protein [Halanaerobiales bacterium]